MADGFVNDFDGFYDISRYIGQTVTIFTTSGGLSGAGFTGILISVGPRFVKLIAQIGAAPECPVGSSCTGPVRGGYGSCGFGGYGGLGSITGNIGGFGGYGGLGSVVVIPVDTIASFVHNAI